MWARRRTLLLRRVVLDDARAKATGTIAGRARTSDIVDASVVEGTLRRGDLIISFDEGDLAAIAAAISRPDVYHPVPERMFWAHRPTYA